MALGSDISCFSDIGPTMKVVSEKVALAEAVGRRLITERGTLLGDPDYGTDVRQWLQATRPPLATIARLVEVEALKDERVASATARVAFDSSNRRLTISLDLEAETGDTFALTLAATAVSVELLTEGT